MKNFFKGLFKKDPIIGIEYEKLFSADKIYHRATILEISPEYFTIKCLYMEDVSTNFIKVAVKNNKRNDFKNLIAYLAHAILKYTGEQGDYLFYSRLSKPFFLKNFREVTEYLHPFIEYEKHILKYVKMAS